MTTNEFENSRISEGTLRGAAQHNQNAPNESNAISRDDVRDGFAEPPASSESNVPITGQPKRYRILAASTLPGDRVRSPAGEALGTIEEIMLDLGSGRIAYAVLSFGGFLGIGGKLFAVPWSALQIDSGDHEFILDVDRQTLEKAHGFDKGNWPDMASPAFGREVYDHYGKTPWWEHTVTDAGDFTGGKHLPDRSGEYEPTAGYQSGLRH